MTPVASVNGVMSPPQSTSNHSPRIVLAGNSARILCVADIRGDYHELNRLIREHEATAVIHTGDFGFLNADSMERMGDKILRHLLQYSPLIPPATRNQLLSIPAQAGRSALINQLNSSSIYFPLSQFPHLLSGAITFSVPVFTVWGLIEDVRIVEKFRTGEYEVNNLTVIDEASSALIETGGVKLRLFGLGGAVALHKMFDNGEGFATIAGGQGTMWTTALQMGELVDTAQRCHDPTETRMLITSAPVTRTGLLSLLALGVKADLTISAGLHFRYPASLNDFAVYGDFESYRQKLVQARDSFIGVYDVVKDRVEGILNEQQQVLLKKVIAVVQKIPTVDDNSWTNTWHWVLADALCGHLLLSVNDGRVSAEMRSNGLNFAHRANQSQQPPSAPMHPGLAATTARPPPADKAPPQTVMPAKPPMPIAPKAMPGKPPLLPPNKGPMNPVVRPLRQPGGPGMAVPPVKADAKPPKDLGKQAKQSPAVPPAGPLPPKESRKDKSEKAAEKAAEKAGDVTDGNESPRTGGQTPKRFSLYLKGLPNPTTEAEIRTYFGPAATKITGVKLVYDAARRQQKNFAYVDFANESDMQETLKDHTSGTIRETTITVELSNPPIRNINVDRSRGGRAGRRVARGGSTSSKDIPKDTSDAPKTDTPKTETPKSETPKPKNDDK